jgi:hypothetical protein
VLRLPRLQWAQIDLAAHGWLVHLAAP